MVNRICGSLLDHFEELGADKPKTVVDLPLGKDPLDALMDEDDDYEQADMEAWVKRESY